MKQMKPEMVRKAIDKWLKDGAIPRALLAAIAEIGEAYVGGKRKQDDRVR